MPEEPGGGPPWAGRRGPWSKGHGFRPPWWPEDLPFPPTGPQAWRMRRRFIRRAVFGLVVFLPLMVVVATIAIEIASRAVGGEHPVRPFAVVAFVAVVLAALAAGRAVRRTLGPVEDVMEAADRVAHGDYGARVEPRGTPDARRLAASFNAMAERIETDEARRRDLLADIAHELRTPLAVIRGNVEGMLDGVYPAEAGRLRPVLDEAIVMDRLLDDLRTLSTAEAGALELHRETVDAAALVEDAVTTFGDRAGERNVSLEARAETVLLEADPVRLGEVLANLLANAIRHTPSSGRVTVASRDDGDRVVFEVTDTGSGILAEDLPHVFERFVRSRGSTGSGLGLAIAKRLVEAHGGTIEAESGPVGTTMRFAVPTGPSGSKP